MTRILFVCLGNICRSTMAEYVMRHLVRERGLEEFVSCDSAGTSTEEMGNPVHPGTRRVLARHGIPCGNHHARQMTKADYDAYDLLIGMDGDNLSSMYRLLLGHSGWGWGHWYLDAEDIARADPEGKVRLLLDWSEQPRDIADPWYTHDFDTTYRDVLEGCEALLDALA